MSMPLCPAEDPAVLPGCLLSSTSPVPVCRMEKVPGLQGWSMNLYTSASKTTSQIITGECVWCLTPGHQLDLSGTNVEIPQSNPKCKGKQGNVCTECLIPAASGTAGPRGNSLQEPRVCMVSDSQSSLGPWVSTWAFLGVAQRAQEPR